MSARSTAARLWISIEDRLIPALRLTTHERSLYYHLLRRTRLVGRRAVRVSRRKLAAAMGLSTYTARHYLRVLARKNCVRFIDRGSAGCLVSVLLPDEIASSLPARFMEGLPASFVAGLPASLVAGSSAVFLAGPPTKKSKDLSAIFPVDAAGQPRAWPRSDPFREKKFRLRIFRRDRGRCFYCRRALGVPSIPSAAEGRVPYVPPTPSYAEGRGPAKSKTEEHAGHWTLDHIIPQSLGGDDSASNLVACCHACNSAKADLSAQDFLKSLDRRKLLSPAQLRYRLRRRGVL